MIKRLAMLSRFFAPIGVAILLSTMGGHQSSVVAQTAVAGPKITSVLLSGWTATTAQVSIVLSEENAEVQLEYGPSRSYGALEPTTYAAAGAFKVYTFNLTGLTKSTTYHYRIKARAADSDVLSDTSADRSFTTRSSDSGALPIVTMQSVICADTSCTLTFSTSVDANVKLGWDTASHVPSSIDTFCNPPSGYPNCVGEPDTSYTRGSRQIRMTGLTFSTKYYFRFASKDVSGNPFISGGATEEPSVTTSESDRDRTFPTGGCTYEGNPFPIGACLPDGSYCSETGPDVSCTNSCGATCPSGSTCRDGGSCPIDPALTTSPYQCNKPECYNASVFKNPAPAGCYATWPKCSANTILKVKKDRGCDLWLTCGTSVQSVATKDKPAENLCLSLSACNQLGVDGQCSRYLPPGQCDNDPLRFCANDKDCEAGGTCTIAAPSEPTRSLRDLTFATPTDISKVANLSGNVIAGLDWVQLGSNRVVQGKLPWQLMRQLGGNIELANADFETNAPDPRPWEAVPIGQTPQSALSVVYEDQDLSVNHVMEVTPVTQAESQDECVDSTDPDNPNIGTSCDPDTEATAKKCQKDTAGNDVYLGGKCLASVVSEVRYSGVASQEFVTVPSEYYVATARVRAENGNPILRLQFGYAGYEKFTIENTIPTFTDVIASAAWQTVTIGPLQGLSGGTRIAVVCPDNESCGTFQVDDLMVKPVLQVNTNPEYLSPSCRLYPREDAPSCDYTDQNGIRYKGWKGFCLESDSVTGSCLSWWPVDIIRGESDLFGSDKVVGYQDRAPAYYCVEAAGLQSSDPAKPYVLYENYNSLESRCNPAGGNCTNTSAIFNATATVATCSDGAVACIVSPTKQDKDIYEDQISMVHFELTGGLGNETPSSIKIPNTPDFKQSTAGTPYREWSTDSQARVIQSIYYNDTGTTNDYWEVGCKYPTGNSENLNTNCVYLSLGFDKTTRRLVEYRLSYNDSTGDEYEGAAYKVNLYLKETCDKIVQAVTPYGLNRAFAQRINSKVYQVPELTYKRSTDVLPYSGIAGPEPANDPSGWSRLFVETRTAEFDDGQTRSGSPYACRGNCSTAICHMANPDGQNVFASKGNILKPAAQCTAIDSDTDGKDDGYYSGGVAAASNKGTQLFDGAECISGICAGTNQCLQSAVIESCTATRPATGTGSTVSAATTDALNDCKENSNGRCSNNIFRTCQTNPDCTVPGYCSLSTRTACTTDSQCSDAGLGTCRNERTGTCNLSGSSSFAIACDGRCGTGAAARGDYIRFNDVAVDSGSVVCTKPTQAACVASTAYRCQRSGAACTAGEIIGCNGDWTDRCVRVATAYCQNDPTKSCTTVRSSSPECVYSAPVDPVSCGVFSGCTCSVSGQCTVTGANTYQNAGAQAKACNSNDDCRYNEDVSSDKVRFFAQEKLKRLFAQSYGIWEWKSGSYVKQDNSDPNDLPAGETFFGWTPPTEICEQKAFAPPGECSIATDTICNASVQITSASKDTSTAAQVNALQKCQNTVACNGSKVECSAQGKLGTKVNYTGFDASSCTQTADGKWTCTGRCTVDPNKTYTNTILTPSTAADTIKIIRPNSAPGDYCAIPPRLSNLSFTTGTATNAVIDGGSGSIGLKFTTDADPEQQPLSTIDIDWGDGSPVESFYYPYAPRTDVRKPHVFSHVYTYNSADNTHCNESGTCLFPIKVRVRDAWNWCSNASRVGSTVGPDGTADISGCELPSSAWPDSILSVTLNP